MGPSVLFKLCRLLIKMRLSLSLKGLVSSRLHGQEPLGHLVEEEQDRGSRPDLMGTQGTGSPLHVLPPLAHPTQASLASSACQAGTCL